MNIGQALKALQRGEPVVVDGKTVHPEQVEQVKLETGEEVFWVRSDGNLWLAIDTASEEVFFFQDLDETLEAGEDTVLYSGTDCELSYEGSGTMYDEDGEEIDQVRFRDYETGDGVIRIVSYEVTGDDVSSVGQRIPEEDLQEA